MTRPLAHTLPLYGEDASAATIQTDADVPVPSP